MADLIYLFKIKCQVIFYLFYKIKRAQGKPWAPPPSRGVLKGGTF